VISQVVCCCCSHSEISTETGRVNEAFAMLMEKTGAEAIAHREVETRLASEVNGPIVKVPRPSQNAYLPPGLGCSARGKLPI